MRIGYVYQDQYPWDVRVEKIATTLTSNGIEVHIISRNRSGLPRSEKPRPNLFLHRLPHLRFATGNALLNFPAFFSPVWLRSIWSVTRGFDLDLLIVRDLPLAPAAYVIARLLGKPVIMDMAENYPAMLQDTWTFGEHSTIDYILRNPALLRTLERQLIPCLDGVLVVSAASRDRVAQMTRTRHEVPVWIVGNTPLLNNPGIPALRHQLADHLHSCNGVLKLVYVGGLEKSRGLETVVRSLPLVQERGQRVLLTIIGSGSSLEFLKRLARDLRVERNVVFAGWVSPSLVPPIVSEADIGLVPHYATEHTHTTLPNKLFDYMAQSKPVIVTNCRALEQIVIPCDCGRVYAHDRPDDLAEKVLELSSADTRHRLGCSGRMAVESRYNWTVDAKILLEGVQRFAP